MLLKVKYQLFQNKILILSRNIFIKENLKRHLRKFHVLLLPDNQIQMAEILIANYRIM